MPRQNKMRHPVKLVREATGLSQKKFAALVGHSKDTIQAIEIGRHKPSLALTEKIFVQTGALPDTLREMQNVPFDIEGECYTRDSFDRWTSTINNPGTRLEREKGAIRYLCWLVTTLQHAALRAGKLFAVQYQLDRRIAELVREFRLKNSIAGLLRDRPHTRFGWLQMFKWKSGEPKRLLRNYVARGKSGLTFGQQEIFGFSATSRDRHAAIATGRKLHSLAKQSDRSAGRKTATPLKPKMRRKISPRRRRDKFA